MTKTHKIILTHKKKILLFIILIVVSLMAITAFYRYSKIKLLDKSFLSKTNTSIKKLSEEKYFTDQETLLSYIKSFADDNDLEYTIDDNKNIIFETKVSERKSKLSPTVICASYNYITTKDNSKLLSSILTIAKTKLDSGKRYVILFNDENNLSDAYLDLDKKYIKDNSKVIYLDYGQSSYISESSYGSVRTDIVIPAHFEKSKCDTAIKIKINGLNSDIIDTNINKQPNPIMAFSAILTRLKSKSVTYQLADFKLDAHGNMYPTGLEATILLNSYSVDSVTKYIDDRIKKWEKKYKDNNENMIYEYEVIDNLDDSIKFAYDIETSEKLSNILYTLNYGTYKFDDADTIPDGFSKDDIYGINAVYNLRVSRIKHDQTDSLNDANKEYPGAEIKLGIMTQAYDKTSLDKILSENYEVAELFGCSIKTVDKHQFFDNKNTHLTKTIKSTYMKVNELFGSDTFIQTEDDQYMTPCSYLQELNPKANIIHIRMNKSTCPTITNAILCYMQTKGNFLSL